MNSMPPASIDLDSLIIPDEDTSGPFPAPSEPLQYRAIGIVYGRYEPSEERITQGKLHTADGVTIDAVLLGRVLSLVRKHLDLAANHPWVVYPRTREGGGLHTQIVGVWSLSPDGLKSEKEEDSADTEEDIDTEADGDSEEDEDSLVAQEADDVDTEEPGPGQHEPVAVASGEGKSLLFSTANLEGVDGFFSIRGEVAFQSHQEGFVLVKIRQQSKKKKPGRAFKLRLEGFLPDDARGKFWDIEVRRTTETLDIQDGTPIATLPKPLDRRRGGPRRPGDGGGFRGRTSDRESSGTSTGLRTRAQKERGEGLIRPERPFRPIDRQPRPE